LKILKLAWGGRIENGNALGNPGEIKGSKSQAFTGYIEVFIVGSCL
jgi:hypothetical protein